MNVSGSTQLNPCNFVQIEDSSCPHLSCSFPKDVVPSSKEDSIQADLIPSNSGDDLTALFFSYLEQATAYDKTENYGFSLLSLKRASYCIPSIFMDHMINNIIKNSEKQNTALNELNSYILEHPTDLMAFDARANIFKMQGKEDLVIQDLTYIIQNDPLNSLPAIKYRAIQFFNSQKYSQAILDFELYLNSYLKNPIDLLYHLNNHTENADLIEVFLLLAISKKKIGEQYNLQAALCLLQFLSPIFSNKKLVSKLKEFRSNLDEIEIHTFINLGDICMKQDLYMDAIEAFNSCLQLNLPQDNRWYVLKKLGECYEKVQDKLQAKNIYYILAKENPSFYDYYRICGELTFSMNKLNESLNFYNLYLSSYKNFHPEIGNLDEDLTKYIESHHEGISLLNIYYKIAFIKNLRCDFDAATSSLNKLIQVISSLDLSKFPVSTAEALVNKKNMLLILKIIFISSKMANGTNQGY